MSRRRWLVALLVSSLMVAGTLSAYAALSSQPLSATVPYDGFLEFNGAPTSGQYDFTFRLFTVVPTSYATDAALDAQPNKVWQEVQTGVTVSSGKFTVQLGSTSDAQVTALSAALAANASIFLVVSVRDAASLEFTPLQGAQNLGSVAYAHRGAPGQGFVVDGNTAVGGGLTVGSNVGIGGDRANFPAAGKALVVTPASQGLWNTTSNAWEWRWDNGTLAAGSVPMNVVSREYTDVFSTTSTTWVDVPGFSATITPASTSSRVLVMANVVAGMGGAITGGYRIVRGNTPVALPPDVAGYTSVSGASFYGGSNDANNNEESSTTFLDTPGTTLPVTYKIQVWSPQAGWLRVNALGSDAPNATWSQRSRSSLTLMELK